LCIACTSSIGGAHLQDARPAIQVSDATEKFDATALDALGTYATAAADEIVHCLGPSATRRVVLELRSDIRTPFAEDPAEDGSVKIILPSGRFDPGNVGGSRLAIHHELTHALIPGAGGGDRLLVEGLGVHMQDLFGSPNYPDLEQTPYEAMVRLQSEAGTTIALKDSEAARLSSPTGEQRQLAYAQQGAFVRWLIGTGGLSRFMQVYEGRGDFETVYGASLDTLERTWRAAEEQPTLPRSAYCSDPS
jgi:hypothetical protein